MLAPHEATLRQALSPEITLVLTSHVATPVSSRSFGLGNASHKFWKLRSEGAEVDSPEAMYYGWDGTLSRENRSAHREIHAQCERARVPGSMKPSFVAVPCETTD